MIEEVVRKAQARIVTKCCVCDRVRLNEGYIDLNKYPIMKQIIEAVYDYSHGVCDECEPKYIKKYG